MAGRGEYQKQLAALWSTAKAHNLKFTDIIPDDLEEEFSQMKELKEAREMIENFQKHEEQLQAAKEALTKDLNEKQSEIDNLPAEYQSAKIDLQQAQRQLTNNKDTIYDLNERIERYRTQAKGIIAIKQADASATEKIENLQMEVENQQNVINKLKEDNRKSVKMFEQLREADTKALERKQTLLAKKDKELAEKKTELARMEGLLADLRQQMTHNDNTTQEVVSYVLSDIDDGVETLLGPAHDDLLAENVDLLQRNLRLAEDNRALEEQHVQMKTQLHEILASQESSDRVFAAVVSETKTLFHFYQASSEVIASFANSFSAEKVNIPSLYDIEKQLDAAQEALRGYFEVKDVVRAINNLPDINDLEQVALCKELDSLAATASDSAINLEALHISLWAFLNQLSHDPKMMSDLNGALCDEDRRRRDPHHLVHIFDLNSCD
ncbi:hypothetical protein N0V86_006698 [Didymella sp. IMI 355093]|nr:hypothetical protein N0V86_006698 [Didymella sp. IMI 355093]